MIIYFQGKPFSEIPNVLFGNQCDILSKRRAITYKEGEDFALRLGFNAFVEGSAKSDINVKNAFHCLVRQRMEQTGLNNLRKKKFSINSIINSKKEKCYISIRTQASHSELKISDLLIDYFSNCKSKLPVSFVFKNFGFGLGLGFYNLSLYCYSMDNSIPWNEIKMMDMTKTIICGIPFLKDLMSINLEQQFSNGYFDLLPEEILIPIINQIDLKRLKEVSKKFLRMYLRTINKDKITNSETFNEKCEELNVQYYCEFHSALSILPVLKKKRLERN